MGGVAVQSRFVRSALVAVLLQTSPDVSSFLRTFTSKASGAYPAGLRPDYLPLLKDRPDLQFIKDEIIPEKDSIAYKAIISGSPHLRLPNNGGWVIGWELINDRNDDQSGASLSSRLSFPERAMPTSFLPSRSRPSILLSWLLESTL